MAREVQAKSKPRESVAGPAKKKPRAVREASGEVRKAEKPRNLRVSLPVGTKAKKAGTPALIPKVSLVDRTRGFWSRTSGLRERLKRPGAVMLRSLGVILALAGAVAVGRLLQHHLTTSKAFAIDHIDVQGLTRIERDELLDAAGIDLGTNVFLRSPEDVQARLLRHPWIATASVTRRLPGKFAITVREREPVALLVLEPCEANLLTAPAPGTTPGADASCEEASALYLVSDEGTLFKRLEGEDPIDLPVITGVDRQRFGTDAEFRRTILARAVALLQQLRDAGLAKRLAPSEIHLEAGEGFSLYVGEELTHVRLGLPPFEQKLRRMKKVFDRLEREHAQAEYVYLDNEKRPDRVTVRLR